MRRFRVIPVLLLFQGGLYKTTRFGKPVYIGDPVNAVKIFNEKEVDELVMVDIGASRSGTAIDFIKIKEVAGEAFMPMGYGGGVSDVNEIRRIIYSGFEKVIIGTAAHEKPYFLKEAASQLGGQSIVVSIDYRRTLFGGSRVYVKGGQQRTNATPFDMARRMEELGVGELLLHSIDRDGTYKGYDLELIQLIAESVSIPIIACGGASGIADLVLAVEAGASAVAGGSMFVYRGRTRGILLNYPSEEEIENELLKKI